MEGPYPGHPHPYLHHPGPYPGRRGSRDSLEGAERPSEAIRSAGSSVKDVESSLSSGLYSRDSSEWYKPYYPDPGHPADHDDHDNSHDSGTASTTLCSSSTSSSPSPSNMLTPGSNNPSNNLGNNNNNMPRGLLQHPPLPPPHPANPPPNLPLSRPLRLPQIHRDPNAENSYAEIPYGSLPMNNFDMGHHQNIDQHGNLRNDWKKNSNLVSLNLGLEYPPRTLLSGVHAPGQNGTGNGLRTLDVVAGSERGVGAPPSSIVHLRDGPDGLLTLPRPRMATLDVPLADFKGAEKDERRKRKSRQVLMYVVVMALAGIAYLVLGGIAGYYYGKSECATSCTDSGAVGILGNTSTLLTTTSPDVNSSTLLVNSSTFSTTPVMSSTTALPTTSTTTTTLPTTESTPSYCQQAPGECRCGPLGGSGGKAFSDRDDYSRLGNITGFTVKHNDYFISGLQIQYGSDSGAEHGYAESGYGVVVELFKDELIQAIEADFTEGRGYLSRLAIQTTRRVLGPYGGEAGHRFLLRGSRLLYIEGQAGSLIDQLTFVFNQCT